MGVVSVAVPRQRGKIHWPSAEEKGAFVPLAAVHTHREGNLIKVRRRGELRNVGGLPHERIQWVLDRPGDTHGL